MTVPFVSSSCDVEKAHLAEPHLFFTEEEHAET